jgi:hypothetical protein
MRYDSSTYRKHKDPGGWGSLCPTDLEQQEAQELLDTSVEVDDTRYNVRGSYCYRAYRHGTDASGTSLWHGHPIPWSRLPTDARKDLIRNGRLTNAEYKKALRKGSGSEFDA